MNYDQRGRAYTTDIKEAKQYRIKDRSPNWGAIKGGGAVYEKRVKLYSQNKEEKRYYLPPKYHNKHSLFIQQEDKSIQVKDIMKLWEGQAKAVEYVRDNVSHKLNSIIITSEVGTGKSILMLGLTKLFSKKTLIIVPSLSIGYGIRDKFQDYCDVKLMDGKQVKKAKGLPDVLVIHRSSANSAWEVINGAYDVMLVDEVHHLSDQMKKLCNEWKGSYIIGLTGTPFRRELNQEDFLEYFCDTYETGLKSLPVHVLTYKYYHKYSIQDYIKASQGFNPESTEPMRNLLNNNEERLEKLKQIIIRLYHGMGFRKIMVFVDRRDYQEKVASLFNNVLLIHGDSDKEEVIQQANGLDEFLIIGMLTASGEGLDIPGVEVGVLFFSTSREGSLEQMVGRAKRFAPGKEKAYRVDFQDISIIEPDTRKDFGARNRLKYYKNKGREVSDF